MSVYFITARELGRVKIGYTASDPHVRLRHIQVGCPCPIKLEALIDGGRDVEAAIHQAFTAFRVRGEWFELCPAIELAIRACRIADETTPHFDIDEAVSVFGSASELARRLGIPMTTVATWRQKGRVPTYRREAIARLIEAAQ